jgi:aspartate racemase
MHILGIVGGIGPESTIDYYRSIIAQHRVLRPDGRAPSIVINSIDVAKLLRMVEIEDFGGLTRYLLKSVTRLADAGAEIGLFAANTPHVVFDRLAEKSPIPLISIVEATRDEVTHLELKKPAILGTRFTMNGTFYPDVFKRARVPIVAPNAEEQEMVHSIYVDELLNGVVKDASRTALVDLIGTLAAREGIDSVILGGTELSMILKEPLYGDVVTLDTTQIHVRAAVERMLS